MDKLGKRLLAVVLAGLMVCGTGAVGLIGANAADIPAGFTAISTPQQLSDIRNNLSGKYILTADIDLTGINWTPIGATSGNAFTGVLDGNGKKIKNLTINYTGGNTTSITRFGLFGFLNMAEVKNIIFEGVNIYVDNLLVGASAGSVCAFNQGATISNCVVASGSICILAPGVSSARSVGGISGENTISSSKIENCANAANITSDNVAGGIAGKTSGNITGCRNAGIVTALGGGYISSGGICGEFSPDGGTVNVVIENCYNTGEVIASAFTIDAIPSDSQIIIRAGGIVGYLDCSNFSSRILTIQKCYNSGNVSSQGPNAVTGGICGYIKDYYGGPKSNYAISSCVVLAAKIEAVGSWAKGSYLFGYAQYTNQKSNNKSLNITAGNPVNDANTIITPAEALQQGTYTGISWDFANVWQMPAGGGYPVLRWQSIGTNPQPDTYTVTYNANGGTGAPATQTKLHSVDLTLSNDSPTRGGYTFKGWATTATATTAQYQPGGSYTADEAVTLWAVWEQNTINPPLVYAVNYNANCPSPADVSYMPAPQIKNEGVTLYLDNKVPTRTGYTFKGWATSATATTAQYQPGGSYTADVTVTLYAVWEENLPARGFWGTNPKWTGAWWHYILFFVGFGFIWMWFF